MSTRRRFKEPKIDWLFRTLFKVWSKRIEERRFVGLRHRPGLIPPEPIDLDTRAQYYTNRETRSLETIAISDLEAKSSHDDRLAKYFGTLVFLIVFALSVLSGQFDELRVAWLNFRNIQGGDLSTWPVPTLVVWMLFSSGVLAALFVWMLFIFFRMDILWESNIDSFFASTARAQMEALRDCMRVFKRFLKWRRYMRLMIVAAVLILVLQCYLFLGAAGFVDPSYVVVSVWSQTEVLFACWFLFLQAVWFLGYWTILVYYTTYRDPTLQLCIMVNFLDRARVATVNVGGGGHL